MDKQRKDGGQLQDTLEARTIIDYCLPHPSQCPGTINNIAKIYLTENVNGVQHRAPIFKDFRQRAINKYNVSKVVDRKSGEKKKFPFFK